MKSGSAASLPAGWTTPWPSACPPCTGPPGSAASAGPPPDRRVSKGVAPDAAAPDGAESADAGGLAHELHNAATSEAAATKPCQADVPRRSCATRMIETRLLEP